MFSVSGCVYLVQLQVALLQVIISQNSLRIVLSNDNKQSFYYIKRNGRLRKTEKVHSVLHVSSSRILIL
jgi:hypothetical protein